MWNKTFSASFSGTRCLTDCVIHLTTWIANLIWPKRQTNLQNTMTKTLVFAFGVGLLAATINAEPDAKGKGKGDGKGKGKPSPEMMEIMKKYDTNGDKKLDEKERASISEEDKAALAKMREGKGGKGGTDGKGGKGGPDGKGGKGGKGDAK